MDDPCEVRALPPWREALKRFLEYEFRPGDTITHEWLAGAMGLTLPTPQTPYGEGRAFDLLYLKQRQALFAYLLLEKRILLRPQAPVGFVWVLPSEQAAVASADVDREVKKAMRRAAERLTCTDLQALTAEQRREHVDALAKLAMRDGMMRERFRNMLS